MAKRNFKDEDSIPGLNLMLDFPFRKGLSVKKTTQDLLEKYCKDNNLWRSKILRNIIFDFFQVKDEVELLKNNKTIRDSVNNVMNVVQSEMGVDNRDLSKHFDEKINIIINEKKYLNLKKKDRKRKNEPTKKTK